MNDSIPLHWSFNYNHGSQRPDYAKHLIELLHKHEASTSSSDVNVGSNHYIKHVYQILPNYWRGYSKKTNHADSLCIGEVEIERQKDTSDLWNYQVRYQNNTNGEKLLYKFSCRDENYRSLDKGWHVDVQNISSDRYSELSCKGYRSLDSEIRLSINGTEISAGNVDSTQSLTCNWALFDVIPAIADDVEKLGDNVEIVLLDDLEQLRPNCKIGFLDSIQSPIQLKGYFLYGVGALPSYWWVDVDGNTTIVSTVFETYVLKEMSGVTS